MIRRALLPLLLWSCAASGQETLPAPAVEPSALETPVPAAPPEAVDAPPPATPPPALCDPCAEEGGASLFRNLRRDLDYFALVNARPGLSFHKPMYLLPFTYSENIPGKNFEVMFQLSLKQEIWNEALFVGYSQRSFWQLYNRDQSRPFRETNYNPEAFYRWKPRWRPRPELGFDFGADHESNGKDLPDSRSWNRLYLASYFEGAAQLAYLKVWYRLPEDPKSSPEDTEGDDNPDIQDFYGYGELNWQFKFEGEQRQMLALMVRANPATGKGAINLNYSARLGPYAFWEVYLWQGYGESLLDYDTEVTRIGFGVVLAR